MYGGWPERLVGIAELIGRDAALRLAERFGGASHYIPRTPHYGHVFLQVIDFAALSKMCTAYHGDYFVVPRGPMSAKKLAILACIDEGLSIRQTASKCGCSTGYVEYLRRNIRDGKVLYPRSKGACKVQEEIQLTLPGF